MHVVWFTLTKTELILTIILCLLDKIVIINNKNKYVKRRVQEKCRMRVLKNKNIQPEKNKIVVSNGKTKKPQQIEIRFTGNKQSAG